MWVQHKALSTSLFTVYASDKLSYFPLWSEITKLISYLPNPRNFMMDKIFMLTHRILKYLRFHFIAAQPFRRSVTV